MAIYTSYDEVGLKEDIEDVVFNTDPTQTPFVTGIGTYKITQKVFAWQIDKLDTPNGANAQLEGFTAVPDTLVPTVLLQNTSQIFQKTIDISGTADASEAHGRAKESAYQIAKKGKSIKRDLEVACIGTGQSMVLGSDSVARTMAGVQAQVIANAPSNLTYNGAAGSGTPLTETALLNALESIYTVSDAEPTKCLITPANALNVATFAQEASRYRVINDASKSVTNAVTLYASPYGDIAMVMDRFLLSTDTIIYDPSTWHLAVLRPWFREVLAKTGDSTRQMIVGEYSLKGDTPISTGIIRTR